MDLSDLKPGERVRTIDGNVAEIIAPTADGRWIKVRYIETPGEATLAASQDLCTDDEIIDRLVSA